MLPKRVNVYYRRHLPVSLHLSHSLADYFLNRRVNVKDEVKPASGDDNTHSLA